MMRNPIYRKDEIVLNRGFTFTALVTVVNAVLALLVLINLYSVSQRALETGEIRYSAFLDLYHVLAAIELLLLLMLAPGLTASSISGERERRTLGLLLTTQMSPAEIVLGKFFGALSAVGCFGVSTLPIMMTVFLYGGIGFKGIFSFVLLYLLSGIFAAAAGMMFSALLRTTTSATISSYALVFTSFGIGGTLFYYREMLRFPKELLVLLMGLLLLLLSGAFLGISVRRLSREFS